MTCFLAAVFGLLLYDKFSRPMKDLVNSANRISKGDYSSIQAKQEDCEDTYYEISQLNQAFMAMNDSIESYTETLLDKNRQINTILDTIEGTLMIVDIDGMIKIQSKVSSGITQENITRAIAQVNEQKQYFTEQLIVDGGSLQERILPNHEGNRPGRSGCYIQRMHYKEHFIGERNAAAREDGRRRQLSAAIVHELKTSWR